MAADQTNLSARQVQHLRTQKPEFTVAQHHDLMRGLQMYLLQNFEGGRQWFGKDRRLIAHVIRHGVEIGDRNCDILGEGAIRL